jgi:hypothetical protein
MELGDLLQGLFGAGTAAYLADQDFERIEGIGDKLDTGFTGIADSARTNTNFTPYTITGTGGGSASTTASGNDFGSLNLNLSPEQQAQVDATRNAYTNFQNNYSSIGAPSVGSGAFSLPGLPNLPSQYQVGTYGASLPGAPGFIDSPYGASMPRELNPAMAGLYNAPVQAQQFTQGQIGSGLQGALGAAGSGIINQLGIGTGRSEADIYGMLEGMQQPDRERERLALRDELASQGRLGTQTAQYGGTPEELARAKAVEEARSANAFRAFQLAGEEQGRLANQRLNAFQIGEQAAGRQDRGLLESFGLADRSANTAANLTNILGSLGLQGQDIGNRFLTEILGQGVTQRGQDIQGMLQGAGLANDFNLGLFGQQSQNALENERIKALSDELGIRAADVYGNQQLQQYATQMQGNIAQGQNAVDADRVKAALFGSQVQQQLGELQGAQAAYRDSFLPQEQLLREAGLGADIFEIQQRSALEGERLAQNADINRMENMFNMETLLANTKSQQNQLIANILLGSYGADGTRQSSGLFDGVFDWLGDSIGDIFNA